jgi:hypothetical protein
MCIIAAQLKGSPILSPETLRECWTGNPHGAGYMFVAEGAVVIRKPFFKLAHLLASYARDHADYGAASPFVLHFRWATHGPRTPGNTHPHVVKEDRGRPMVAMVHNGILNIGVKATSEDSDTVVYCREVLAYLPQRALMGGKMRRRIGRSIGSNNKFVLLDNAGKVSIVNEREGEWDGQTWYSNDGYKPYVAKVQSCCGVSYRADKDGTEWEDTLPWWMKEEHHNRTGSLWADEFAPGWIDKNPNDMTEAEWKAARAIWEAEDRGDLEAAEWLTVSREMDAAERFTEELRQMDLDWDRRVG